MLSFVEYVWVDGTDPVKMLRSKTKVVASGLKGVPFSLSTAKEKIKLWNFDGSSTSQAPGNDSERLLKPVRIIRDPVRCGGPWGNNPNYIALCEVLHPDGSPHKSNTRAKLRKTLDDGGDKLGSLWGFEQEYVLLKNGKILGWPDIGYPGPQGPYYCGVGTDEVVGRDLVEDHARACGHASLLFYGLNAEVMLGQWEFQIGYRGFTEDRLAGLTADPLTVSDHLWLARWLLYRIGERHGLYATLDPKPVKGAWNGSGMHTNFSTDATMSEASGAATIKKYIAALEGSHMKHQKVYGHDNESRLTGDFETAPYAEFSHGTANRGASIRVPNDTANNGYGYLEDRRPAANADPYVVTNRILKTIMTCD